MYPCDALLDAVTEGRAEEGRPSHTQNILEADVEGRVGVRREDGPLLPYNVLGPAVFVANSILDLSGQA